MAGMRGATVAVAVCAGAVLGCAPAAADPSDDSETGASETGASETGESETGESGETGAELGPLLRGEPEIIHHPNQPMIVDLVFEFDAPLAELELVHAEDDDVRVALLDPGSGSQPMVRFRVRGLLPDATHPLSLSASEAEGARAASWTGSVTTDPPLPGFVAKFEIESEGPSAVEPIWRLFDMTQLFATSPAGTFMVDDEGTTRWYIGDLDDFTDLDDIYSGLALRPDGSVLFTRRDAAWIVTELNEVEMEVSADALGATAGFHHDLIELANGNFIALSYSFADVDYLDEGTLHVAGDLLVEFTPAGELVWTWDSFDYFDPQRRRDGFFSVTKIPDPDAPQTPGYDWTHGNGLVYDEASDTVYLSTRHQDWITAIDHQTGEILWNLGDEGDFALAGDDDWFFHQHSPQWQPDGTLLLYDNAVGNPAIDNQDAHSRAVRYALDFDTWTATLVWSDDDPAFVSPVAGDADRTPGGHILRLDSTWVDPIEGTRSRIRELDPEASPNAVWTLYAPPGKFCYRAVPIERFVGVAE